MNGHIESAQAVDVIAEDRKRVRELAVEVLVERDDTVGRIETNEE
ncbi:hypothetical protein [Halorubrum ezzemoulense]|nr:hypothetical protein [Halorubrum ezzemoulense]MDB9263918.1 hypothetical protein [Halorubrum ezzemoulense]MDB9274362.1 hypothetical protein [Halorubrum ezzemoulense]MDB9288087.1 hypothetical protein [Halorubrum ezzemoulense]MDB9291666.1 hypothetical protein [Halorubrum ezzemoulense]MDB9295236.1 hypothetical protein [Halorubrum ezzemoulense]